MKNLQIFKNEQFGTVRTIEVSGEPWFVGKDVADCLAYSNSRKALADHVDSEDKGVTKCDTLGGKQELTIINESGLYSLILGSHLPTAKQFKHWITAEVIPYIRKTGTYSVNAYHPKSTSLGEVTSFIKVMRSVMKENGQSPEKIAEMAETVCKQFHVDVPENFVARNPFQQTNLFSITFNNNILPQKI